MRDLQLYGKTGVVCFIVTCALLAIGLSTTSAIVVNVGSGALCDCQPSETCECALFNEEHPTVTYEGVEVTRYTHVDGEGGGRALAGSLSDPFNSSSNTLCSRADDAPDATRCPEQCSVTGSARERVGTKRVRRAIGQLSDDEWGRVVAAMWEMKNLTEAEGQAKYGPDFRSMDYHNVRHVAAGLPLDDTFDGDDIESHLLTDVTGGGAQTYPWHGLFTMEFETSLLQIDPSIGGLPYIDWGRDVEVTARRLGQAMLKVPYEMDRVHSSRSVVPCSETVSDRCQMAALADGDFAWWPVTQFNMSSWYASQSESVQTLFAELYASGLIEGMTASNNGQLRCDPIGRGLNEEPFRVWLQDGAPDESTPIPYVLRYLTAWEAVLTNQSTEWNEAAALCVKLNGLFQDASECIEGRMRVNQFQLHFNAHFIGGDMQFALVPQDPFFFFHHCGLDRLRRQWQARNERVRPMAYGYPAASTGYTEAFGTPVGLYDCLGCTAHEAGFTRETVLGNSPEYRDLPLSEGWLTPADLLCVLDDLYTYDVLLNGDDADDADESEPVWTTHSSSYKLVLTQEALAMVLIIIGVGCHARSRPKRHLDDGSDVEMHGTTGLDEASSPANVGPYDMSPNDAHIRAGHREV